MGARGPAPKSTNLRILEGNPSRRPLNHDEPQPEAGAVCPDWLSACAKAVWDHYAPVLTSCGILTKADTHTLAAYCDAAAKWRMATEALDGDGELVDDRGMVAMVRVQRNYSDLMAKFGTKLGLSPGDRTGIKTNAPKEVSKWSAKIPS